jgi:Domain of unknown function (DUF4112)
VHVDRRLEGLRAWQRLLDTAFRVPGTGIRFGWDPIIGLVPWVGDAVTALFGSVIIFHAYRLRLPRIVQLRMLINIAIDIAIGIVPLAGDVVDLFWKSNARNFALLEHYAGTDRPVRRGDWLFVAAVLTAVLGVALLPAVAAVWVLREVGLW